jgi:hypothetical protein
MSGAAVCSVARTTPGGLATVRTSAGVATIAAMQKQSFMKTSPRRCLSCSGPVHALPLGREALCGACRRTAHPESWAAFRRDLGRLERLLAFHAWLDEHGSTPPG